MTTKLLVLLGLFAFATGSEIQGQIQTLRDKIQSLEKAITEEHAFLVESMGRVERLESLFNGVREEKTEVCKYFIFILIRSYSQRFQCFYPLIMCLGGQCKRIFSDIALLAQSRSNSPRSF